MLTNSFFFDYLWVAPAILQIFLAILLFYKKLYKQFPWFFSHAIFVGLTDLVLFYFYKAPWVNDAFYTYADSTQTVCLAILRFGIIYEIFRVVVKQYPVLRVWGDAMFRWATMILVVAAVGVALYSGAAVFGSHLLTAFTLVRRTITIVQCGLLLLLILSAKYLKLSWRNYSFGIAVGMGVNSAVRLFEATIRAQIAHYPLLQMGKPLGVALNFFTMSIYHLCVLLWLGYLFVPEPAVQHIEVLPSSDLESWNDELERLLQR